MNDETNQRQQPPSWVAIGVTLTPDQEALLDGVLVALSAWRRQEPRLGTKFQVRAEAQIANATERVTITIEPGDAPDWTLLSVKRRDQAASRWRIRYHQGTDRYSLMAVEEPEARQQPLARPYPRPEVASTATPSVGVVVVDSGTSDQAERLAADLAGQVEVVAFVAATISGAGALDAAYVRGGGHRSSVFRRRVYASLSGALATHRPDAVLIFTEGEDRVQETLDALRHGSAVIVIGSVAASEETDEVHDAAVSAGRRVLSLTGAPDTVTVGTLLRALF